MKDRAVSLAAEAQFSPPAPQVEPWRDVCALEDILPGTGVAALLSGHQIAIFRPGPGSTLYALSNFDPFSRAYVLSRGILGDKGGLLKVASPVFKQNFSLETGQCMDDPEVSVPTYPVRVVEGRVQINVGGLTEHS